MLKGLKNGWTWLNKARRRKFYLKLMMTTALIAILPNLVSNVVAYYQVSKTVEQETGKNKLQYLNQTINAVEMVLKRIKENSNLLALNQSFQDYERYPNGTYYEHLQGEIPTEDLPALYGYLETKKNAQLSINAFKLSNAFVDSVYFYDNAKNLIMTSENGGVNRQFSRDAFFDTEWYTKVYDSKDNPIIMDTRVVKQDQQPGKSLLSIVYKSTKPGNALIVNLDAHILYTEIVSKLNQQDHLFAFSTDKRIMLHEEAAYLNQPLNDVLPKNEMIAGPAGSHTMEWDQRNMLISYAASPMLHWTFVNASDMEALTHGTASIKRTITGSAMVLVVLSTTLAYLSSRRLYRPISRLNELTAGLWERKTDPADEIHSIGNFVKSALDERNFYKEKLDESLPFHRERFKYDLLYSHSLTLEEIERKKAYLGIDIDTHDLAVLLLSFEGGGPLGHSQQDIFSTDLYRIRVMEAISECGVIPMKYFMVDSEKDKIAIVLSDSGMERQQVFQLGLKLLEELKLELQSDFSIGVGRVCTTICELPQAYEEASEALKYRIAYGKGYVISIEDMMIDAEHKFTYPKQKAEQLLSHIKMAREQEAIQTFDQIMAEINACRNTLHYNQIQPLFVQLLTGFMNAYTQLGADRGTVFGSETDLYRELLDLQTLDQIRDWFHRIIHLTTVYIEQEMSAKGNHHIAKVLEILERDYSRDISLNTVAEQLNLNPAYISRLFKQKAGQPFVEYIKHLRIAKSKELLENSSMKINEVGKRVGYDNAYYFIRVFKETMGLTPGEYKKLAGSLLREG